MTTKPEDTSKLHLLEAFQALSAGVPIGALVERGSIEAMESAGQSELVASESLPTEVSASERALLELWGFRFGEAFENDPLFMPAVLPEGWTKAGSDHAMWSKVLDEKGRERVEVFYKAAFYDRRAFMRVVRRYGLEFGAVRTLSKLPSGDVRLHELGGLATKVEGYCLVDRKTGEILGEWVGEASQAYRAATEFMRVGANDPSLWDYGRLDR